MLLLIILESESRVDSFVYHLIDLGNDCLLLHPKDLAYVHIINVFHDLALHHSAAIVIFDVTFPATFWHVALSIEALLLEKLCRIVICICQKVLQALLLGMRLELVHQASPKTTDLLASSNG